MPCLQLLEFSSYHYLVAFINHAALEPYMQILDQQNTFIVWLECRISKHTHGSHRSPAEKLKPTTSGWHYGEFPQSWISVSFEWSDCFTRKNVVHLAGFNIKRTKIQIVEMFDTYVYIDIFVPSTSLWVNNNAHAHGPVFRPFASAASPQFSCPPYGVSSRIGRDPVAPWVCFRGAAGTCRMDSSACVFVR